MTALSRLLTGAGRVRVLAAMRVRTATAGSTAALRAAATRASAPLRAPGSTRSGSPRWTATVRPAMDRFLQADLLRRTRDALLRARPLILRDPLLRVRPVLSELRSSFPSTTSLRPALRDLFQALPRPGALVGVGGDGEEALRRRLLERLPRFRLRRRGPRAARHVEPHADDVLVVDDDDDRMAAKLEAALRRLCKAFWDAFLDRRRLETWVRQTIHSTKKTPGPGQRPRRLRLRPARPRTPLLSSSSPLRGPIHSVEPLDWIILANIAAVAQGTELQVHLSAETPPRPSTLSVSAAISGPFTTYVAAVLDPGHLLLLRARPDHVHDMARYYLSDIASGTATRLPVPGAFLAPDTIGIVSRVDGDGYLVLALQNAPAAGMRTVLCFDSRTWTWSGFAVSVEGVPVGGGDRPWSGHAVVSHGGRIAWADLRRGFLLFDAHAQERTLRFVSLPKGRALPAGTTGVDRLRCAALSQGVLRYAELIELDVPHVELWRFDEEDRTWLRGGRVRLDAGLHPDQIPWIAVIHPHEDVVFVMMGSTIHAIDVRRGRVIAESFFQLPPSESRSSYFVRAWELIE